MALHMCACIFDLSVLQYVGDFPRLALALGTGGRGISLALGPGLDKAAEFSLSRTGRAGEGAFAGTCVGSAFSGEAFRGGALRGEAAASSKACLVGLGGFFGSFGSRLCASSTPLS